jgi:hypothetical protein
MDRQARDLAGEIPQGDIDCADGTDARHSAARPEIGDDALALERVAVEYERFEKTDQALGVDIRGI